MEHNQVFENHESAHAYSLTVPWKLKLCHTGESCWCRIIVPIEPIKFINKIGDTERIDEIDYIIPDGCIDKETAEYFLELHHNSLKSKQIITDSMEALKTIQYKENDGQQ